MKGVFVFSVDIFFSSDGLVGHSTHPPCGAGAGAGAVAGGSQTPANTMNAVEQRVWLLHWALFALFTPGNSSSGPVQFADTFFFVQQDRDRPSPPHYLEAASLRAPYLYRYATAALVLSKRKKHLDKLIKVGDGAVAAFITLYCAPLLHLWISWPVLVCLCCCPLTPDVGVGKVPAFGPDHPHLGEALHSSRL